MFSDSQELPGVIVGAPQAARRGGFPTRGGSSTCAPIMGWHGGLLILCLSWLSPLFSLADGGISHQARFLLTRMDMEKDMSSQAKEPHPAFEAPPITLESLTRRVLVLVHGPDLSMAPVLHALHLASKGAGQVMVAVKDPALAPAMMPFSRTGAAARWAAESDTARARAMEQLNEDARRAATERGAALSVMGPIHSAPWLQRALDGASLVVLHRRSLEARHGEEVLAGARDLVLRVRRPVLVAPPVFREPVRLTAAYAGKALGSRVLETAAALSRGMGLPLTVYTAGTPADRERAAREARQELDGVTRPVCQGRSGPAVDALIEECRPGTLTVMGAFGSRGLRRLILGGVTKKVLRGTRGPLLLVNSRERNGGAS